MPNIAAALKAEISRIARKEIRAETMALRKTIAKLRHDLVLIKRQKSVSKASATPVKRRLPTPLGEPKDVANFRFSATWLSGQRRRLGLSVRECGLLVGTTAQSIYNWEAGKTHPRPKQLVALGALKALGQKEARQRIESMS